MRAAGEAWDRLGGAIPRPAWPDPLPPHLTPDALAPTPPVTGHGADELVLTLGLADDPDHQRHVTFAWHLADGPLLGVGLPGSGTSTLAATAVLAATERWGPAGLHVHIIDLGPGTLRPLAGLDHVGAVVGATEVERQRRLLADLADELGRRQAGGGHDPRRLLVVDGLTAFRSAWDDLEPTRPWSTLLDLAARGAPVGLHLLVTADGSGPVPHQLLASCRQRLVFRLADRGDHAAFGIPTSAIPDRHPGRAVAVTDGAEVQVASPAGTLTEVVAGRRTREAPAVVVATPWSLPDPANRPGRWASPIPVLPEEVGLGRLARPWATVGPGGSLTLAIGVDGDSLGAARLHLGPDGHAVVAGPRRSGRSTALATLAAAARAGGATVILVGQGRPEPGGGRVDGAGPTVLDASDPSLGEVIGQLRSASPSPAGPAPLLVLVDDADLLADEHPVLAALATTRSPGLHLVVAGQTDRFRSRYGHWAREVLAQRTGLLLAPDLDLDGDLLGTRLPRRLAVGLRPGLAWRVNGGTDGLVQLARPPHEDGAIS